MDPVWPPGPAYSRTPKDAGMRRVNREFCTCVSRARNAHAEVPPGGSRRNGPFLVALMLVAACDSAAPHTYIPRYDPRELDAFGAALDDAVMTGGKSVPPPEGGPLREG